MSKEKIVPIKDNIEIINDCTEEIQDLVSEYITEINDLKDKYLRTLADFDNYKKNVAKQNEERNKYKNEDIFKRLIEIADIFDDIEENEELSKGIELGINAFRKVLLENNVQEYPSTGMKFSEDHHNAVMITNDDTQPDNTIIDTWKKGYLYKDKILRYSQVVVNKITK